MMHRGHLLLSSFNNSDRADAGLALLQVIASELSRVMLIAIEVAVEYWLALTWSPQAQWLSEVSKSGIIQDEVPPSLRLFQSCCVVQMPDSIPCILHKATFLALERVGWSAGEV